RKLRVDELARPRMPQEVVGRREEEALEVRPPAAVETADDCAFRRSEIGGLAEPNLVGGVALGDLRDRLYARTHLEAREALREDDPERLRRWRGRGRRRRRRRRACGAATGRDESQQRAGDGGYEATLRHSR